MRWSMPIMAFYLIDAGFSHEQTIEFVAGSWYLSQGDEDYIQSHPETGEIDGVGAYAIPPSLRTTEWPGNQSKLAADAVALWNRYGTHPAVVAHLTAAHNAAPHWVHTAAETAAANPIAGYVDREMAMQSMIPLPIIPRP